MVEQDQGLSTQLRRGVLEYCTLALIEAGPTYGFAVARALHERGLLEGEGTLYPILARLRQRALVETEWSESPNGPHRRYYRVTTDGAAALKGFRHDWSTFSDAVDELMGEIHA